MKPLVIYHDHCQDGYGAAFAAWVHFGDEAEYLPMSYGNEIDPLAHNGRDIYVLDFSFSEAVHNELLRHANKFVLLDHHKTAFETLCCGLDSPLVVDGRYELREAVPEDDAAHVILDNNKSGALIAWEYFHGTDNVPQFIRMIDDRDRWQFKISGSKEFHAGMASLKPWTFEMWDGLFMHDTGAGQIIHEGSAILRAHEQNVKAIVDAGRCECTIVPAIIDSVASYKAPWVWTADDQVVASGLAANCPPYAASDVGQELANQSGTFGLCWYQGRNGKAKCSLRSNGDYDVSAIAQCFGGGGHRNSAGFEVDLDTLQGWLTK